MRSVVMANSANRHRVAAQDGVAQQLQPHNAEKPKMGVSEIQEIGKKLFKLQLEYTALNFEVIEDTLLIDAPIIGKRKSQNKNRKRRVKKKRLYSREQLEALMFENLDGQKKKWAAVYGGLRPVVAAEYDGLVASVIKNHGGFDRRPDFGMLFSLLLLIFQFPLF